MSEIAVPAEEGTHTVDGFEVTVEEADTETFMGYPSQKVGEFGGVDVYEDTDGDYWLTHRHRNGADEGAVLVSYGPLYDIIEDELDL